MKTKFSIVMLWLMTITCCLNAQTKCQDWFIEMGASANLYMGENDAAANFGHRIAPAATFAIGKWINPYWAVRVGSDAGKLRGAGLGETPYTTGEAFDCYKGESGSYGAYYEKWNFVTVRPEVVYNVSNGMCGYNNHRVWNVLVHCGPVYGHSFANGEKSNVVFATCGVTSQWRVARKVRVWLDGRFTIFGKKMDKVTYRGDYDCMAGLSAGVTFNMGSDR